MQNTPQITIVGAILNTLNRAVLQCVVYWPAKEGDVEVWLEERANGVVDDARHVEGDGKEARRVAGRPVPAGRKRNARKRMHGREDTEESVSELAHASARGMRGVGYVRS